MSLQEAEAPQAGVATSRGMGQLAERCSATQACPDPTNAPHNQEAQGALSGPWFPYLENLGDDTYLLELP